MAKLPSFNDLTDINKLKEMGSSLAESATHNVGAAFDKVKSSVESLTGEKEKIEEGDNPIQVRLGSVLHTLDEIGHTQRTLTSTITKLRKQVHELQSELVKSEKVTEGNGEVKAASASKPAVVKKPVKHAAPKKPKIAPKSEIKKD